MILKERGSMSDLLTRAEPVPTEPFVTADVKISLAPPMARYSLRARQVQALETLLGVNMPKKIGATEGSIICLGPDEWLLRGAAGMKLADGSGLPVAITDVSERSICITIEGAAAAAVLMAGCSLDLDQFAVGRATRTIFETVEIVIVRETENRFQVEVWRSFADWLWTALTTAASH
jgi:sarcosine oxidase subunit gamma